MREAFALGGAEGERGWAPAKAATLDRLRRAGLPVPPGVVFGLDPAALAGAAVAELLALGPVIVRSALAFEDQASSSGAGLGRSIGGLRTLAAVQEATQEIAAEAAALRASGGAGEAEDAVIVQAQVDGRALAVLARESTWPPLLEVFSLKKKEDDRRASLEVLSVGGSPGFSGALDDWRDPAAAAIAGLWPAIEAVVCAAGGPEGFEAELVIDAEDRVWVVQARPLTRSLLPGFFSDFLPALVAAGAAIPGGRWALDAEHNPAPLSPAHAWLIGWLALQRPGQRRYCVLAGWLYREVAAASARARATDDAQGEAPRSAISALRRLLDVEIPAARRRLGEIEALLAEEAVLGEAAFVAGEGALLAVVDAYTSLSRWARRADATTSAAASAGPRCLVDRRRFADVLPTAWDVASPTLAEVQPELSLWTEERKQGAGPVVDEEEAGLLLGELDDHLFALGLAPWRRLYLRAAALLGVDKASIFSWTPPELRRVLRAGAVDAGDAAALVERGAQARLHAALRPPAFLAQGRPLVSAPTRWMRGLGIGARAAGVVAQRRDLEELLKDPPAAGAIVVLPALTAQAALAIAHLGVCAVVTAYGGALSHGALIARELGLSALLGCRGCLEVASGTPVIVDTQTGWLRLQDG